MPNWCHNKLDVRGDPDDVAAFVEAVRDDHHGETTVEKNGFSHTVNQPLTFEKIIPMPEEKKEDWYEWRIGHWGTKWNANFDTDTCFAVGSANSQPEATKTQIPTHLLDDQHLAHYEFHTAWSPPEPVFEAMVEQWPQLAFTMLFGEPGGGYAGRMHGEQGVVLENIDLDLEEVLSDEEMWF